MIGSGQQLGFDLADIKKQIINDTADMDEMNRSQIIYASYIMPANIVKELLTRPEIDNFVRFEKKISDSETLKKQWDKEIEDKITAVETIKKKLDEFKTAFNFVGLYDGFAGLKKERDREEFKLFWSLMAMGFLLLVPFLIEIAFSLYRLYQQNPLSIDQHLVLLIPLISAEVILIYFFRILLHNYSSVKAQKMQIELRQTLCQFIQSYAEYSSRIKKQDSSALEKFENLIFSGILADPEKLPSTYDGIDQVVKLVKAFSDSNKK
jgi:hypothetical protein